MLLEVAKASGVSTVDIENHQYTLRDKGDYAKVARWLLGHDPFVLHYLLSPQKHGRYLRTVGLQRLIDDVASIRLRLIEMADLTNHQANVISLLNNAKQQCSMTCELSEALIYARKFYANISHAIMYLVKQPTGRSYKTYTDLQSEISSRLKQATYRSNDGLKAEWLQKALRLGIIVDPIDWILRVSETGFDPVDDWMDFSWYDEEKMKTAYGLRNVGTMFPDLVTCHG